MKTDFGGIKAYIYISKVKDILPIYYVAVRGRDKVEGAVQRVLNKRRISSIKNFILTTIIAGICYITQFSSLLFVLILSAMLFYNFLISNKEKFHLNNLLNFSISNKIKNILF